MPTERPPTLDPVAAARWAAMPLPPKGQALASPWLHDEVAKRMQKRLDFIRLNPASWAMWEPLRSGLAALPLIQARYPQAALHLHAARVHEAQRVKNFIQSKWWQPRRWTQGKVHATLPETAAVDMMWANMLLHQEVQPQDMLAQWHQSLAPDGFLMFSCLGPDTLRELREVHRQCSWPEPAHEFTDMHDWGDMQVQAGFAEPVMDMERITLTYINSDKLLADLRALGRNLHRQRFQGLRGKSWLAHWHQALLKLAQPANGGPLSLSFEVVYGHAMKPQPRMKVSAESQINLSDMRQMLRNSQKKPNQV